MLALPIRKDVRSCIDRVYRILEHYAWLESQYSASSDGNLLAGLWIPSATVRFLFDFEITKAGNLQILAGYQRFLHGRENLLDDIVGFNLGATGCVANPRYYISFCHLQLLLEMILKSRKGEGVPPVSHGQLVLSVSLCSAQSFLNRCLYLLPTGNHITEAGCQHRLASLILHAVANGRDALLGFTL